jgi:hypothetical protein
MGFLSKLVNKVTGGWAEVTSEVPPEVARGTTMTITAEVDVEDEPIDIEEVAVQVQCITMVAAIDTNYSDGVTPPETAKTIRAYDVSVAGPQQLAAGSHHSYSASFDIPADVPVSDGEYTWMARTIVRMSGNDPDSRWQVFSIV